MVEDSREEIAEEDLCISIENAYNYVNNIKNVFKISNRFYCDKNLDDIINKMAQEFFYNIILVKDSIIYRARIYQESNAEYLYLNPSQGDFRGYDEKNSFVNKTHMVKDGRCNTKNISYLYASKNRDCCIYEIRPNVNSYVSIAEILVLENLNLMCIDNKRAFSDYEYGTIIPNTSLIHLFYYLCFEFCSPVNDDNYSLSQYISEKIRSMGYDGIAYNSAVYTGEDNINYVIFNYDKTKAINSKLYKI